jgi:hypothetical protein
MSLINEIGGYLEFETYSGNEFHQDAIALNCGRNCLAYLIEAHNITSLHLPRYLCSSVFSTCQKYGVQIQYYQINEDFTPRIDFEVKSNEWFYLVNYYGQLSQEYIADVVRKISNLIVDNAQAFFQSPINGIDTFYTCRKYFGVSDGAYLYTDSILNRELEIDISFHRMNHILARFEIAASEYYSEYVDNNKSFADEPIKYMSKLTHNLLRGIDYQVIKKRREENFKYLHEHLKDKNKLQLRVPEGPFAYPLLIENGAEMRKALQQQKIYIPTLWPNVLEMAQKGSLEYEYAANILPLPCDQRYGRDDMEMLIKRSINRL